MADRTVLVTGASTGIGEATAKRLAKNGWRVYAGVRRPLDGERLVEASMGEVVPVHLDVTVPASIDAAVARIRDDGDRLDGVVNNAGIAVGGPVEVVGVDEWRQQFEVNVFGVVAVTQATWPLVEAAVGRFVHIGSIAGRVAAAGLGPYAASKHAVSALNWSLRGELDRLGTGMHSSVIEPGEIKSAIWGKGQERLRRMEADLDPKRYGWLIEMMTGFLAEADEKAIDADRVAEVVEEALTAKRPKARYAVGNDAKLQAALARMPDRIRELGVKKGGNLYVRNGRKLRSDRG